MKISLTWIVAIFLSLQANAGVNIEAGCYQQLLLPPGGTGSFFYFQSYRDERIMENIGALLNYNNSKNYISLIFHDEIQNRGSGVDEYKKYWLEIIERRITGQYVEVGSYGGNPGGRYIKYTNFKTNKVTTFRLTTIDSPCAIEH